MQDEYGLDAVIELYLRLNHEGREVAEQMMEGIFNGTVKYEASETTTA